MFMESEERHPIERAGGPPDWLTAIPLDVRRSAAVTLGGDKTIAASTLFEALEVVVGEILVPFSVDPRLARILAQHTENASWLNVPTEVTSVKRTGDDEWLVKVGDHTETLSSADIWAKLGEALGGATEEGGK